MTSLWQMTFLVPAGAVDLFLDEMEGDGVSLSAFEDEDMEASAALWCIEVVFDAKPKRSALTTRLKALAGQADITPPAIELRALESEDWVARVRAEIKPLRIGRFWLHGSHVSEPPPEDSVPIELDAGLAFGSGEHESTAGCLEAIDRLATRRRFRQVLDLGCGAGILAIAAAKCWPARVLAVDNDPVAVDVAAANAATNGVANHVRARLSEGYANPDIGIAGPFDLILANILANPLRGMARDLARNLAPDGWAILAGILDRQVGDVVAAHMAYGLFLRRTIAKGPWTTLIMSPKKL